MIEEMCSESCLREVDSMNGVLEVRRNYQSSEIMLLCIFELGYYQKKSLFRSFCLITGCCSILLNSPGKLPIQ